MSDDVISQSQAASDDRLLSHVTLGRVECSKQIASAQTAERFEPNTVFWAFHTIQPSSFRYCIVFSRVLAEYQWLLVLCCLFKMKSYA